MHEMYMAMRTRDAAEAAASAASARSHAASAEDRIRALEDRIDSLLMVCQAQWALIEEATGLTEERLLEKVREIDLSDGVLDGRVRVQVAECTACGRTLGKRHKRCLYCGADRKGDAFRV